MKFKFECECDEKTADIIYCLIDSLTNVKENTVSVNKVVS